MSTHRWACPALGSILGSIHPARPGEYLLGVECDGATYHRARSARDRDRLRQEVLEGLGWRLHRIWSTDWFRNPARATDRLLSAIRDAETRTQRSSFGRPRPRRSKRRGCVNFVRTRESRVIYETDEERVKVGIEYKECSLVVPYGRSLLDLDVARGRPSRCCCRRGRRSRSHRRGCAADTRRFRAAKERATAS